MLQRERGERERDVCGKGGRRCEMQPAHCFTFTLNNVITARSLASLRFAFPSCLFPLDFLIFLFYFFVFFFSQMSGRGRAASPFVNSFIYFSLRGNFLQWYSHPDNSERKGRGKRYYCLAPLTQSRPCWTARHLVITVSLFIFDSITLSQCRPTYIGGEKHTHLLLDWIKYDITKATTCNIRQGGTQ